MKKIRQLTLLYFLCVVLFGCENQEPKKIPPNILFIAIDDLRNELGVYGSQAKSPNLDVLANDGSLFTNHYVQVPTCGASRYALMTGLRPSKPEHLRNDAIEFEISNRKEGEIPESFIHHFRRNGYYTVGIGKITHSADGFLYGYEESVSEKRELPHSWDELLFNPGKWETGWNAFFAYANGKNRQSLKKQVKPYEAGEVDDEGYPDGLSTNLALSKLRELKNKKQPFFMGLGLFKPHLPFNAPKKYWDLYERDSIALSENPRIPENIDSKSLHESGEFNQYALGEEKASLSESVTDDYARKLRHGYLASISYIDTQVGKVLEELKRLGLEENTIVVVWGDHGWHLGDQRVWGKHTLFENALKSTLIVKSPHLKNQNKEIQTIVESVDIYPTLMEISGIPFNHKIDGESFAQVLESASEGNEVAYSYFKNGISMRTEKYRLTKYFRDEEPVLELYDHDLDSNESNNIAAENSEIVADLMHLLEKGNTGLYSSN
ncbi:sulfatase [Maribacter algarum]|uniref:sulfatase n=1 Tax=Maribacter algarum (ex Zhang et al. 2020) TaxID=2578118 RepID=UPI001BB2CBF5|nr:sulfatase [Maribacter algarum]